MYYFVRRSLSKLVILEKYYDRYRNPLLVIEHRIVAVLQIFKAILQQLDLLSALLSSLREELEKVWCYLSEIRYCACYRRLGKMQEKEQHGTNLLHEVFGLGFAHTIIALLLAAVDDANTKFMRHVLRRIWTLAHGVDRSLCTWMSHQIRSHL